MQRRNLLHKREMQVPPYPWRAFLYFLLEALVKPAGEIPPFSSEGTRCYTFSLNTAYRAYSFLSCDDWKRTYRFTLLFTSNKSSPSRGSIGRPRTEKCCFVPRIQRLSCVWSCGIYGVVIQGVTTVSNRSKGWVRRREKTAPVCISKMTQWAWTRGYR